MFWAAFPCMTLALSRWRDNLLPNQIIRQPGVPIQPNGVKTLVSPDNVTMRYKEPSEQGVCESSPGVKSYSGYLDLDDDTHMFFWFFEARRNAATAPITLWLNGGPGADSLIGLFEGKYLVRNLLLTSCHLFCLIGTCRDWPLPDCRKWDGPAQPLFFQRS